MPQRSNLFQDTVAIVHRELAGDATVTESAMLTNRLTNRKREVDVVVERDVAGQRVVVAVEAVKNGRRASVEWVERMLGKHENLPTDKLVLVAEAGFTKQARELAAREFAIAIEPEDLAPGALDSKISDGLGRTWPKIAALTCERVTVTVLNPSTGERTTIADPAMDLSVVYPDLQHAASLIEAVRAVTQTSLDQNYATMVRDVAKDADGTFCIDAKPLAEELPDRCTPLGLTFESADNAPEFHPIVHLHIEGSKRIRVRSVALQRKRINGVEARYGSYEIDGDQHSLVITSTPAGENATLRVRSGHGGTAIDFKLDAKHGE